jgi:mannose-6-phosphate isomerase-like protein (cupin superfamily)
MQRSDNSNTKPFALVSQKTKTIAFASDKLNLLEISFRNNESVCLKTRLEGMLVFKYNKSDEPHFKTEAGESVIEFSGVTTDKRDDKSCAIVNIAINGYSPKHHHNDRTEIYYIIQGEAKLIVDDITYILKAGDTFAIDPKKNINYLTSAQQKDLYL